MDELRGPSIQIVLHLKEGVGFGFLKSPFIVSGSLNGYTLETDPVVPCHAPVFDAELVWEADKRRFRNLRVQNVPVKMEVYTTGTQGRRDKVGYMLLSLLGAQPCPNNRVIDLRYVWHRLLGVKSEGKCCHPQLMLSLSIQDRTGILTPRNELRMFHSSSPASPRAAAHPARPAPFMTVAEYIAESKKTVTSAELEPRLLCDEGIIQIGAGADRFILSLVVGAVENVDVLLPNYDGCSKESNDCYIAYSVFTHNITTDRVAPSAGPGGPRLRLPLQQRSSLRLRSSLRSLHRYFAECPRLVLSLRARDTDIGITSLDLRKLIPTTDLQQFTSHFCNADASLTIHERCYLLVCDGSTPHVLPFVDVEMSLRCVREVEETRPPNLPLTARSVTQLESTVKRDDVAADVTDLQYRSGSCTQLDEDVKGAAYTNISSSNTNRYRNAAGDATLATNDIADMIKRMCDNFASSQQQLLAQRPRPATSDVQVQCEPPAEGGHHDRNTVVKETGDNNVSPKETEDCNVSSKETADSKVSAIEKEAVKQAIPAVERDAIMQRFVNELEDWKEKQQELYKCQLIRKEEYHLELLSKEWTKRRDELEMKLARGIEQCRNLATDLSRATEDFRLRGYRNTERERKLLEAKNALEQHYTAKYQQLREASQTMEQDMNRQLRAKDQRIEDLELADMQAKKRYDSLQNDLKNLEKEGDNKHSGLTKDQTASLIQELRCLEEKLDGAVQSKAFFKEQWGRCVRELHLLKLSRRRQLLSQLQQDRRDLGDSGLAPISDAEEPLPADEAEMSRLKDDYYVQLLANMPDTHAHAHDSSSAALEGMEMYNDLREIPKNPANEKLNRLLLLREDLIKQESPDEDVLQQLNHDIRNILLNYGT